MEHWNGDLNTDTLITLCVAAIRAGKRDVLVKINGETMRVVGGYISDGTDLTLCVDRDQVSRQKEETFGRLTCPKCKKRYGSGDLDGYQDGVVLCPNCQTTFLLGETTILLPPHECIAATDKGESDEQ